MLKELSIANNPNMAVVIVLCWIITGIWVYKTIADAVDDKISPWAAFGMIWLEIFVAVFATILAGLALYVFGFMIIISISVSYISNMLNQRSMRLLDANQAKKRIEMLLENDNNPGAHLGLAEECYRAGLLAPAIYHLERAISFAPQFYSQEKRLLQKWQYEFQQGNYPSQLTCPQCRISYPPSALICKNCNGSIIYLCIAKFWMPQGLASKMAMVWGISLTAGAVAVLLGLYASPFIAIPAQVVILAAAGYLLYKNARATN